MSLPGKNQTSAVLSIFAGSFSEREFMSAIIGDFFHLLDVSAAAFVSSNNVFRPSRVIQDGIKLYVVEYPRFSASKEKIKVQI